jgi:hypothetical protein
MTIKDKDRRKAFWLIVIYVVSAPVQVKLGLDAESVKASAYALTGLGLGNYFSKPQGD